MRNVSSEFRETMKSRINFDYRVTIQFKNGFMCELSDADLSFDDNSISTNCDSNAFPLGLAVAKMLTISLKNHSGAWDEFDFFGAVIKVYLSLNLMDSTEEIYLGKFTVIQPESYGVVIKITAVDDMYKADKPFETGLAFPVHAQVLLDDICSRCDIPLLSTTFLNDNFYIQERPDSSYTYRQVIGFIAMLACGNALLDASGSLKIISYDFSAFNNDFEISGGTFEPWAGLQEVDGGDFTDWSSGDIADGGNFEVWDSGISSNVPYHLLKNWRSDPKIDTDDILITGIKTKYETTDGDAELFVGEAGYVIELENPLFLHAETEALNVISENLLGSKFRTFSGEYLINPTIEFMDYVLIVDRKGNSYFSFISDLTFKFFGNTKLKNSAKAPLRNSSKYYTQTAKAIAEAKKLVEREKTERELAIENLANSLKDASGLYMTQEEQEDKSIIYYMHNKPTLAESDIVWKLTAEAFAISTDGGETYPYGFTVTGETIVRLLSAEGISADIIKGGTLILGGENNINGNIYIKDSNGEVCGVIDNNGIRIFSNQSNIQVVINPLIGIVQRDAEGNDYYGLNFDTTVQLPPVYYDPAVPGTRALRNYYAYDTDTIENELADAQFNSVYDPFPSKAKYKFTGVHKDAGIKSSVSGTAKRNSQLVVTLPEAFKNKKWIVSVINKGFNAEHKKNYQYIERVTYSTTHPTCYGGKTATDKQWYDYDITGLSLSNHDGYKSVLSQKVPSPYVSPPEVGPEYVDVSNKIVEIGESNLDYVIDEAAGTITLTGFASFNSYAINELMDIRIMVTC